MFTSHVNTTSGTLDVFDAGWMMLDVGILCIIELAASEVRLFVVYYDRG